MNLYSFLYTLLANPGLAPELFKKDESIDEENSSS